MKININQTLAMNHLMQTIGYGHKPSFELKSQGISGDIFADVTAESFPEVRRYRFHAVGRSFTLISPPGSQVLDLSTGAGVVEREEDGVAATETSANTLQTTEEQRRILRGVWDG